jgi:hypothetical protein
MIAKEGFSTERDLNEKTVSSRYVTEASNPLRGQLSNSGVSEVVGSVII